MVKNLGINDEMFYIDITNNDITNIRYLKVINSKKCLTAKFINYSPLKYFFNVMKEELVDIEYLSLKDFKEKVKNYDFEIVKQKKENDNYWQNYERPKRDYNWKYHIALGKNENWVIMKRDFLNGFLEDIKGVQERQKDGIDKQDILQVLNKNCDDMLEFISPPIMIGSHFTKAGGSGVVSLDFVRSTAFFDTLLKEFYKLNTKYKDKPEHPVCAILLDFRNMIKNNTNLNLIEKKITEMIIENGYNADMIIEMLNINFKNKNRPFDLFYVKKLVDYIIPNKLYKQYELICQKEEI